MRQLSSLDTGFLALDTPRTPMHIGSVCLYDPSTIPDGGFSIDRLRGFVEQRIHRAKMMRERLVRVPMSVDLPYWINDPDFDIEYHIKHTAIPAPGDWDQLMALASHIFAEHLDLEKPLWEMYVVEGVDAVKGVPKGAYALINKVHHAAIDGLSGIEVMSTSHELSADAEAEKPRRKWKPEPIPTQVELLGRAYVHALKVPGQTISAGKAVIGSARRFASFMVKQSVTGERSKFKSVGPKTVFNGKVSPHRVFGGECFDLAEVKAIKESEPGLKLNDVVLTICAGALHKYLKSGDMLPDDPLLSMVPVSVRSENAKKDLGNQVTVMSVPLGTHIADPDERIAFQHDSQLSRKEMLDAVGAESLQDYSTLLPSALVGLASRVYTTYGIANRIAPIFNTVITNVPGPPIPIYNCGAKMERMYGLVPIFDGMGLGHVVNSYCDVLTISFNACAEMLPDPDFYSACLRESFEELLSVRAPRPKGRKPKVVHDADAKKAS